MSRGMDVLLIGGTGQTGPLVLQGMLDRGANVTLLHYGRHEPELPPLEHIHADAHFRESLEPALSGRRFDLVICMYGRATLIADVLVGKTERLISISGTTYAYSQPRDPRWGPMGVGVSQEASPFPTDPDADRIGTKVWSAEQAILEHHRQGHFQAAILRYPEIYGPDSLLPSDWSIVKRILDKRPHFLLANGGLRLRSRAYRDNAAHAVMCAVDRHKEAAGEVFNVADEPPIISIGQVISRMTEVMGHEWELIDAPFWVVNQLYGNIFGFHRILDIRKIQDRLGYKAIVPLEEAIERTVRWWAEHPMTSGGQADKALGDRFDYALEDRIVATFKAAMQEIGQMGIRKSAMAHPYAHPTKPGEGWTEGAGKRLFNRRETFPFEMWHPAASRNV